jgi:hypothetical protein
VAQGSTAEEKGEADHRQLGKGRAETLHSLRNLASAHAETVLQARGRRKPSAMRNSSSVDRKA